MRARPRQGVYWYCESCEEWRSSIEWSEMTVYWHDSHERIEGDEHEYLFSESCGQYDSWLCDMCETRTTETPLEITKAWECNECGHYYETKEEGDECCE